MNNHKSFHRLLVDFNLFLHYLSQMEISADRARVNTAARVRTGSAATPAPAPTCSAAPTVKLVNVMIYRHVMCWCVSDASWWCFADISQCPSAGPLACEHFCKPTAGAYRCFCARGFVLHSNGRSCSPQGTAGFTLQFKHKLANDWCDPTYESCASLSSHWLHWSCSFAYTDILHVLSSETVWDDRDVQLLSWWTLPVGGEHYPASLAQDTRSANQKSSCSIFSQWDLMMMMMCSGAVRERQWWCHLSRCDCGP